MYNVIPFYLPKSLPFSLPLTHEHIDFVFYAKSMSEELNPGENESNTLAWYSESELEDIKDELLVDIYLMAKEAINIYKECA